MMQISLEQNVKRLYTFDHGDNVQLAMLKSLLDARSIPCVTRGEHLISAAGGVPFNECYLELWVLNDEDFAAANTILKRWLAPENRAPWTCETCGENIEGQFQLCWKCGSERAE
jgi:Putative prokaryotic signal transducing protein